jgi:HSP20 family protein
MAFRRNRRTDPWLKQEPNFKLSQEKAAEGVPSLREWWPIENLRREMNSLLDDVGRGSWRLPFRRSIFDMEPLWREMTWSTMPAIDIVEKEKAYEITAELPGMDSSNIEVKLANGAVAIRGEKTEEKEEKKKDYHLSERRYGSFERRFQVPQGVAGDKIEASFKKGVLTVILPTSAEAEASEKKIAVKAD